MMTYGSVFLLFLSRRQTKALNVAHELQMRWRWLLHTLEATLALTAMVVAVLAVVLVVAVEEFLFEPTPGPGRLLSRCCWLFGS